MKIKGLQKLTLLDFPGKMACTVFTAGCNFKCPFCHNASLVTKVDDEYIGEEEFFSFLSKRKGVLEGVCITGGEPTLQPGLDAFIRKIKEHGFAVKLDTNGYKPEVLKSLVNEGLVDYVAMDIKNSPEKYGKTVGIENFDISPILESIEFLLQNKVDYEFRTTVVKELHTKEDVEKIAQRIKGTNDFNLQGFKDSGDLIEEGFSSHDKEPLKEMLKVTQNITKTATLRGI
jgi:pyruvate formate lyase activating enzyme